jgi:hypothetical protein
MSTPRNLKYFQAMPENLKRLGGYKADIIKSMVWSGLVNDPAGAFHGFNAAVIDLTSATWAADNKRFIVIAEPASDLNKTAAMYTQSHAQGHFIDGSSRFHVFMETPSSFVTEHATFMRYVQQHILGQLAAPMKFWFSANTVKPEVKGVDSAAATSASTESEWMIPYGMVYPGGV